MKEQKGVISGVTVCASALTQDLISIYPQGSPLWGERGFCRGGGGAVGETWPLHGWVTTADDHTPCGEGLAPFAIVSKGLASSTSSPLDSVLGRVASSKDWFFVPRAKGAQTPAQ